LLLIIISGNRKYPAERRNTYRKNKSARNGIKEKQNKTKKHNKENKKVIDDLK